VAAAARFRPRDDLRPSLRQAPHRGPARDDPENLTRSFASVARHGVRLTGARVTITDLGLLRRFALHEDGAGERLDQP
jgi:hypothetical protein